MSRVPPPLPSSKRPLNRTQGDLSDAELAALLPSEPDDDEERPKPPPLPGKVTVKASATPPPLPPGTAKRTTAVAPPPLPGSAGVVSHVPPPVWGKEEFDPEETDSKPKKTTGLTAKQKTLLYILLGSFLGATTLIALLIFLSQPAKIVEQIEQNTQTGTSDTVTQPEQNPLDSIYDLSQEFDDQ